MGFMDAFKYLRSEQGRLEFKAIFSRKARGELIKRDNEAWQKRMDSFVRKAADLFGSAYAYPQDRPLNEGRVCLWRSRPHEGHLVSVEYPDGFGATITNLIVIQEADRIYHGKLLDAAMWDGEDFQVEGNFKNYLISEGLGDVDKEGLFTINEKGLHRAWDLARLLYFHNSYNDVVIENSSGEIVYEFHHK